MSEVRVAIIGLGLIGGSLGLAFRQFAAGQVRVTGYARRRHTAQLALQTGAVDKVADSVQAAVEDADVVFLCTPVLQLLPMAQAVIPVMKRGAILSDVGSTKAWFLQSVQPFLKDGIHLIGAHPMAGREKSGMEAATADLFCDKWFLLTPIPETPQAVIERFRNLISLTGAKVAELDEITHDQVTAVISHVPHVVAAGLVHLLKKQKDAELTARFIGGGFRDTTRIASSDADMWADICMTNPQNIAQELEELSKILQKIAERIREGNRSEIWEYFVQAKILRDALLLREQNLDLQAHSPAKED